MFRTLLATLFFTFAAVGGHAVDLSLGAAMTAWTSPYKKHDALYMPAPMAKLETKYFYINNASTGLYLFKNENHKLALGVSYSGLYFDADDTSDAQLKRLDDRRSTMMGDISYEAITKAGLGRIKVSRDLLGHSDGYTVDATWMLPLIKKCYTIMPGVGVLWSSRKHSDYYFGVSRHESARSGIKTHTAKANFSPYAQLEGKFFVTENWSAVGGVYVNFLTGSVKKSPMAGRAVTVGGALGMQYSF